MDSAAHLLLGISQITQLSPTCRSVITLGHSPNVPLIQARGELSYGLEPHDHIYTADQPARTSAVYMLGGGVRRGVPGVVQLGGYLEGYYTGYPAQGQIEAYLWNI